MKDIKDFKDSIQVSGFLVDKLPRMLFITGFVSLLLSLFFVVLDKQSYFYSYITSFVFFLTISLGSMFFVMILHVTRAGWGIVVRRIAEHFMKNIGLMFFMFLPVLFGLHELYHWTHADAVATDYLLQIKAPYLNVPFLIIQKLEKR